MDDIKYKNDMKTIIPICFSFDNNLVMPACVCISSLLMHAKDDTFYDIYILHSASENLNKVELNSIIQHYKNCRIQYRIVGDEFKNSLEIRGITLPTYYRLLIPELIPEYEKVIYADVDIIFRMDLSELYAIDLGTNYIAATRDLGMNFGQSGREYIKSMSQLHVGEYIQAGFIILNTKQILQDGLDCDFKELAKQKLKYQDQDISNIRCYGKIHFLSLEYNMTDYSFYYVMKEPRILELIFSINDIERAINCGNLHFNGHKPWQKYCVNFDIWWEYYRKSPFYNKKFYFDFFFNKMYELDKLSLWERVKILVRYFIYGRE